MPKQILLVLLMAAAAYSQDSSEPQTPSSFRGMTRLNRAPIASEILKVKLPRPVEKRLSNGIKLLILEDHRAPTVYLTIQIPASALRDSEELTLLTSATAELIRAGTATRNGRQIADALADVGANLNIGVGWENCTIGLSSLSENFDAALEILSDVLLHPSFPADELEKWKTQMRSQILQNKTNPGYLANRMVNKVLYPDDARGFSYNEDSVAKITREKIIDCYQKYFVPSGEWAGIVGDISAGDATVKLEKALSAWKGGPVAHVSLPVNPPLAAKKVYMISRPNSVQTYLTLTNRAINRLSADYIACQLLNQVLGSGPAARLFRIIREEKGYTYGVSSRFVATRLENEFQSSMSVRTEVTAPALTDLLKEFEQIREVPVPKDELDGAKRTLVGSLALGLESSQGVLSRWLQQRNYGLPENYWDTYAEKIMALTQGDVQRVAKKYVPLDNVQIIAVGDSSKIGELLKKFGDVSEFQPDAK
jgi:zinc protease